MKYNFSQNFEKKIKVIKFENQLVQFVADFCVDSLIKLLNVLN